MIATTTNPSDAITISGAYPSRTTFPFVPGFEGVGQVVAVGAEVDESLLERRVLPLGSSGNWQQLRLADASWCVPVPDGLGDEQACFAYINPLTAALMVERFATSQTRRVVVTAATSTIAGHLAELLNESGIEPVAVTRGTPGRSVRDDVGWSAVIDSSRAGWTERLHASVGGPGADVIFDAVGGDLGPSLIDALRPGGALVLYGLLSGRPLPPACFDRGVGISMFRLRDVMHGAAAGERRALLAPVFDRLLSGRLRTRVGGRYGLGDLPGLLAVPPSDGKPLIRL